MLLELLAKQTGVAVPELVVFDIGAMSEGAARYAPLVELAKARVIGFEPQSGELAKLRANAPSTHTYLPHVLGRGGPGGALRRRVSTRAAAAALPEPPRGAVSCGAREA
jgi:hypothetical protein